jgi:hypothetical protein
MRPGLAKARQRGIVRIETVSRVRGDDAVWRALFERGDVMSEGRVGRGANGEEVWFGSTSLILPLSREQDPRLRPFVAGVAALDLHVRLRALRVATREAHSRAPGPLGTVACELSVGEDDRGLRIDVDVQAPLIASRSRTHTR